MRAVSYTHLDVYKRQHQKSAITLSNSFNVLPLKNRITMMNKKRTKEIGRTKYLLFIPLALALMIVSNIEAVARTTKSIAQEVMQTVEEQMEPCLLYTSNRGKEFFS